MVPVGQAPKGNVVFADPAGRGVPIVTRRDVYDGGAIFTLLWVRT